MFRLILNTSVITAVRTVIPKMINSIQEKAKFRVPKALKPKAKVEDKPKRKSPDNTIITQEQFDFIVYAHRQFIGFNADHPHDKKSSADLVNKINAVLHLDKSRTAYSKIWRLEVSRDSLPSGKPINYKGLNNEGSKDDRLLSSV
jgi:hypothetical protein